MKPNGSKGAALLETIRKSARGVWNTIRPELSIAALTRVWHELASVPNDYDLGRLLYEALTKHLGWVGAPTWSELDANEAKEWTDFARQVRSCMRFLVLKDDRQREWPPASPPSTPIPQAG